MLHAINKLLAHNLTSHMKSFFKSDTMAVTEVTSKKRGGPHLVEYLKKIKGSKERFQSGQKNVSSWHCTFLDYF